MEVVRVTEAAALAAARLMGRGDNVARVQADGVAILDDRLGQLVLLDVLIPPGQVIQFRLLGVPGAGRRRTQQERQQHNGPSESTV
jgi:hypothetical protein